MICTKCGREINEDENFCPFCGATIVKEQKHRYCKVCGFELNPDDNFCPNCGTLNAKEQKQEEKQEERKDIKIEVENVDEDLKNFVGYGRYTYYAEKFKDLENTKVSWNICAFFFGPFWFMYHKIFLPAFIYATCTLSLIVIGHYINFKIAETILYFVMVSAMVLSGLFGNYFYFQQYKKALDEVSKKSPMSNDARVFFLKNAGKGNVGFVFLYIAIIIAITIMRTILWDGVII